MKETIIRCDKCGSVGASELTLRNTNLRTERDSWQQAYDTALQMAADNEVQAKRAEQRVRDLEARYEVLRKGFEAAMRLYSGLGDASASAWKDDTEAVESALALLEEK